MKQGKRSIGAASIKNTTVYENSQRAGTFIAEDRRDAAAPRALALVSPLSIDAGARTDLVAAGAPKAP